VSNTLLGVIRLVTFGLPTPLLAEGDR
jgi:hypothetical protein